MHVQRFYSSMTVGKRFNNGMKAKPLIFVVEDEPGLQDVLRGYLERAGYRCRCLVDGRTAFEAILESPPHLVILDILLPSMDGLAILQELRRRGQTLPVILLTARSAEKERLQGLGAGADDYVVKPFSPAEVVLRVEAVLRRVNHGLPAATTLSDGPVTLDETRRTVSVQGQAVALTPWEFRLMVVFLTHPGWVLTREQLLDQMTDDGFSGYDRNVDVHISQLRKKLGLRPDPIRTVYGVGYRWVSWDAPSS